MDSRGNACLTIQNPREILGGGIFGHDYFVAFSCKGRCVFGCCRCQSGCVTSCSGAGRCSTWCCAIEAYAVTQAQATLRRRILRASADTSPQAALTTAARMVLRRMSARCRWTRVNPDVQTQRAPIEPNGQWAGRITARQRCRCRRCQFQAVQDGDYRPPMRQSGFPQASRDRLKSLCAQPKPSVSDVTAQRDPSGATSMVRRRRSSLTMWAMG